MPFQINRPYLKDRREPLAGTGPHGYAYVDGRWFDYTSLSDDAYGNRITEPGMLVQFNTVSGKLEVYDHNNGSPTYEAVGICVDHRDVRNGDIDMNPVNSGKAVASRCWCANTGGPNGGAALTGAGLITAIQARLAANVFNLIKVEWV